MSRCNVRIRVQSTSEASDAPSTDLALGTSEEAVQIGAASKLEVGETKGHSNPSLARTKPKAEFGATYKANPTLGSGLLWLLTHRVRHEYRHLKPVTAGTMRDVKSESVTAPAPGRR